VQQPSTWLWWRCFHTHAINELMTMQSAGDLAVLEMRSQSYIHDHALTIMHSQSCIHNHAFKIMHSHSCIHNHAFTITHSPSCIHSHAFAIMHLQLCSQLGLDLALLEMRSQSVIVGCSLASLFSLLTSFPSSVSRNMSIVRPERCPIELRLVSTWCTADTCWTAWPCLHDVSAWFA